jgi:hypothetical protein
MSPPSHAPDACRESVAGNPTGLRDSMLILLRRLSGDGGAQCSLFRENGVLYFLPKRTWRRE